MYPLRANIPGGVTNTSGTSLVPAGLVSTAVYVPVATVVAVIVRVKLKEVVPVSELSEPQGLPMVYPASSWLMALPFNLHCMVGHGSAVTSANSVTCPPTLGATSSGFPKSLSTVRF